LPRSFFVNQAEIRKIADFPQAAKAIVIVFNETRAFIRKPNEIKELRVVLESP